MVTGETFLVFAVFTRQPEFWLVRNDSVVSVMIGNAPIAFLLADADFWFTNEAFPFLAHSEFLLSSFLKQVNKSVLQGLVWRWY